MIRNRRGAIDSKSPFKNTSPFKKLYSAGEEQSKEQKEVLKRDMRDADAGMIK